MLNGRLPRQGRTWCMFVVTAVMALALGLATDGAVASAGGPYAQVAKKCKKKHGRKCKRHVAPLPTPVPAPAPAPAPAPQLSPLTNSEIIARLEERAQYYSFYDGTRDGSYGYFADDLAGTIPHCSERSTYTATCEGFYGWDDGVDTGECDFYEVMRRADPAPVASYLDTTFGTDGFDCYAY
jgi:hypothetical protein